MTYKKVVDLKAGKSYWLDFISAKGGRNLKIPVTVVDVDGHLMGESFDGTRFKLPELIVRTHPMNEFQRLHWNARCYKNVGNHDKANELLDESYRVMESGFYMNRIEHLTCIWGGKNNDLLQEYVDELRRFRPDLPIDELTFVCKQTAKARAQCFQDASEVDQEHHGNFAWCLKRVAKNIGRLFNFVR
jgi:hypothetical protein